MPRLHPQRNSLRICHTTLRWSWVAILLVVAASRVIAVDLTKDDIDFRKEVYINKRGDRLPYRLFVPLGYSSAKTYPLGAVAARRRGPRKRQRKTDRNEKGTHVWISGDVQGKFPAFVLAPQCPGGRTGPTRN